MKVLIVYSSKYGAAQWAVKEIASLLERDHGAVTEVFNIRNSTPPSPKDFDCVVLGSSVYAGQMNKKLELWAESNQDAIVHKTLGLFVTALTRGDKAMSYLEAGFPPAILARACAKTETGGLADMQKMKWLDRLIMKKVAGITETKDTRSLENLQSFAWNLAECHHNQ